MEAFEEKIKRHVDNRRIWTKNVKRFKMQFNPDRESRTKLFMGQKPDPEHPECILCAAKHSRVPDFIEWKDYCIFPNPSPIFEDHFTLVSNKHLDQHLSQKEIIDAFGFLSEAPTFRMIFNGLGAGASVKSHFHFQGFSQHLPVEYFDIQAMSNDGVINMDKPKGYPATTLIVESKNIELIAAKISKIIEVLDKMELTYNLLFSNGVDPQIKKVYVFPRKSGVEGSQYYGNKPASIEMAGMLVMSKPEDKQKYDDATDNHASEELVKNVLKEVTVLDENLLLIHADTKYDKIIRELNEGCRHQDNLDYEECRISFEKDKVFAIQVTNTDDNFGNYVNSFSKAELPSEAVSEAILDLSEKGEGRIYVKTTVERTCKCGGGWTGKDYKGLSKVHVVMKRDTNGLYLTVRFREEGGLA